MTQQNLRTTGSPVHPAVFPDGPDSVLRNPDVSETQWHRELVRVALYPWLFLTELAGILLLVLAGVLVDGAASVLALSAGILTVSGSVLAGWHRASRIASDHRHGPARRCRLDRVRGEFFLRSRDFSGLGTASAAAGTLFAGVDELYRSPARDWIDPALCAEVHRVAWQALCCLDRTRGARGLAAELAADPASAVGDLAIAARPAVTAIDDALEEVVGHIHACLVLTRAWEAKLRHTDLTAQAEHTLSALPGPDQLRRLSEAAKTLPQAVFAYITAARDVTDAGPFPWEQPTPPQSRRRRALRSHLGTPFVRTSPGHARAGDGLP
ncbi:hypothetical protein [Amycolatopsis vastitatis]|uniref:Uncharacterized protein n=1 Tax=Amycolatopsis vastitatis TaxID=1905142 RepID=A0A229SLE1_9PSEU|nr:hypothetical protein [Amycolatopsis vastitatis]OXM59569.1 hypothetical protein CF165_47055 [Amycolatopsis vastitatis]